MASLNKVILICSLGRDPETSYSQTGVACTKLSGATTERWNDKNTGEKKERTEWHRITFWGKQAETLARYTSKGSSLYIEGKLQTSQYEKNGEKRYSTEIIGTIFQFIGSKNDNQQQGQGFQQQGNFQQPQHNNNFPSPPDYKSDQQPQQGGFQGQNQGFQNTGFHGATQQQPQDNFQQQDSDLPF
ncbi:MAG: single-stranded DNA-binding protein [Desulfobacterales bacterium]|nr:single-stranded DNA-binding protein [Desulfobacterales bacterium]